MRAPNPNGERAMRSLTMPATALAIILGAGAAQAACGIEAGSVRILANDFDVLLGRIEVVVPFVEPGSDYSLVCEYCAACCSPLIES